MEAFIDIKVRQTTGTYQTNTVRGLRASNSTGQRATAECLGAKLFGPSFERVELLGGNSTEGGEVWRVHSDAIEEAWCWQSGLIEFGLATPSPGANGGGAIRIARGPAKALRQIVGVLAREGQGKSTGKYLVPGVPEADTAEERIEALIKWHRWCCERNGKPHAHGVVFGRDSEVAHV
ncbi:MAG: hypothetical protein HYX47_10425 [Burkholderiales bacterium]|nr:hypothetical protein [Burkholderiales bacterium]